MLLLPVVLTAFAVTQVATLVTSVYLHRGITHRGISVRPSVALVFRTVIWLTTGIKPREWAAVHRYHHAGSDTEDDPHSPIYLGFWRVQLGNAVLYRRALRDGTLVQKYARDLPPDRLDRLFFDHAFVGLGIGIGMLIVLFGVPLGLLTAVLHTVMYLGLNAAVNAVGHRFGRRPYANLATNNQWLAWLTSGEGLHNNHHAAPTSARFALDPGQLDPGWWLIAALRRLGLASVRLDDASVRQHLQPAA